MGLDSRTEHLFREIEDAIDEHPLLVRRGHMKQVSEPMLKIDRLGCTIVIMVALKDLRRRPTEIYGSGETPEEAAEDLVSGLDRWAKVMT